MHCWHARISFTVSVKGDVNFHCDESTMVLALGFTSLIYEILASVENSFRRRLVINYMAIIYSPILLRDNLIWFNSRITVVFFLEKKHERERKHNLFYLNTVDMCYIIFVSPWKRLKLHVRSRRCERQRPNYSVINRHSHYHKIVPRGLPSGISSKVSKYSSLVMEIIHATCGWFKCVYWTYNTRWHTLLILRNNPAIKSSIVQMAVAFESFGRFTKNARVTFF